ncbi:uncharacterized protein LOC133204586 [Saccostrea echinata]|uniref:uncharacterized protein LOC133204586 n=1 Tax=Saccostrea echinata TaxID=191078 RepID=UPI002A805A27|nr:uncharacterized protein LOC133204586 [Saccostrea echinata]
MADLSDPDLGAAYYRSSDPVKNLKIRVKLSRISSSNIVPQSNLEQDGSNLEMQKVQESMQDIEERVFNWQQKEFSKREVGFYQNIANCTTQLEKDYNAQVTEILSRGQPTNRLFTYVDHDNFSQQDEAVFFMTNSPKETPTILAEKMAHLRRRKIGGGKKSRERGIAFVPKLNIVEETPSEELRNKNHIMAAPAQVMYIMADLGPKDRPYEEGDEVILCSLQLDANGVLCIRPDFNRGRKPYVAETASLGREVFEYTIEHDSKVMSRQDQDREMKMYREVYSRHKDFLSACVGHEFELPPPEVLRLMVCGEIERAKDFEFDDLYIHFFVDIPKNWKVDRHQQLSWVTQTCATKVEGRDDVAHFSFPFEFEMFYKDETYIEENKDPFPHFPFILMEVLSLDSWNRFRTEGYTYLAIPPRPGVYKETVHCWRPLGPSFVSEMRRFFIGGSPELEDPTYTAIPSTFDGPHLSKYGFRTETTGSVDVKFNVIMQSRLFLEKKASKKSLGSLLDTLGINTVQQNIQSVLDAFKKARQRMVIARENATRELLKDSKHRDDLFSRTNKSISMIELTLNLFFFFVARNMHSGEDSGTAKTPPKKERKKRGEAKKEPQKKSPDPKSWKVAVDIVPRGSTLEQARVPQMTERKLNDQEMQPKMAQNVSSSQMTPSMQGVSVPLSTIQHGSVAPIHVMSSRDDHSSYHRSISPSRPQGPGRVVQRPIQPQQPQWVLQGVHSQHRPSVPLPKPVPQQQVIRELGPVGKHGGERIVLQRHITPPNSEGSGMLRQQLFQKISHYPETQSHENVFRQYQQGSATSIASSVQGLIEQHSKMTEAGRQSGVNKDIPAAHSVERFSPGPQQVSTIRRTPSPAHIQVGRISPVLSSGQQRSPGPSADRTTQPVNLSVSEIRDTLATARVTKSQAGTLYPGPVHRVTSSEEESTSGKDMMIFAQTQGDLLKHALMTGALPPHVQGSNLFQKSPHREQSVSPHHKDTVGSHISRRTPSPNHPSRVDMGRVSPHQQRHPSPQQRQIPPHDRYTSPQHTSPQQGLSSPPQRQISPNPRQISPHQNPQQRYPSPSHSPGQIRVVTGGPGGRDSVSPGSTGGISIPRRTPSPKPQHRHKESMAALTNPRPQVPPSTVNVGNTSVPIRQPFVNLVRLQEVPGSGISVSSHSVTQVSARPPDVSGTQRQNPVLQTQLSQGYEPHISPDNKQKEQVPIPTQMQPRQRNPFTFPPQMPTSFSQVNPHAFSQYKDTVAKHLPQLDQERRSLPPVRSEVKRRSPDEMPRLTPIDPINSEYQDPNAEMVEMEAPFSKRLQNIANLPTSSINRSTYRAHSVAVHRAKAGLITSTAKSLDILRQNLQKFINKEIDVIIQDYMEKFFNPGIRNIKLNNGENSVNEEHVQAVCRQILEEAKKMYCTDQSFTPTRPEISDTVSETGSTGSRRKKGRPPLYVSGRSTPSKTVKTNDPIKREGPKWDCDRLTTETLFVMGAKANKALGLGATRGRIYIKHPETFKYSGDQDDKVWLYENQHMPATGGKTYMLILEDIRDLALEDDYKDNPSVHVNSLKGFSVPQWMIDKIKIQMAALRTDTNKPKSRSRSNTPSDIRTSGQEEEDEDNAQKIPFSSFVSPKTEDQDPDKDEKSSSADTETEFFSGNDNDNTSNMSPFNMTGGFDDGPSPNSELENMEDEDGTLS